MRIFYYTWYENSEQDILDALSQLGNDVVECHIPFKDYENDVEFSESLERIFSEQNCECFFSFNFFPLIAKTAEKLKKRYVSWVYDSPHNTIYSPSILSEYVSVFLFDKLQCAKLLAVKPQNVYHLPLAVHTERLDKLLNIGNQDITYQYEVSFVGSLYENNLYRHINYLPEYLKGYIQGVLKAQQKVYGYNLINDAIKEWALDELQKYVKMEFDSSYLADSRQLYLDMLNTEVTHQERIDLLKTIAEYFDVALFTASECGELPENIFCGTVSYDREMPRVFHDSKINLNITLRSIESGIPLRALDIMGAGGFLLTNYQPEIAEYFADSEEVVMFESKEDMLDKIAYYLEHEEERKRIAYNGWQKVQKEFSYKVQVKKILEKVVIE